MLAPFTLVQKAHLGGLFFDFVSNMCYNYYMLKKFPYVEDYIEVINGDRNPATGKLYGLFENTAPVINLARYDVAIIDSMSRATSENRSLTDKQATLAGKLVLKYRKQLANIGIDISPVEEPRYRLSIRIIDRSCRVHVDNDAVTLKFPYDVKMIDSVRELAKVSQGTWKFDNNKDKVWRLGMTETNIVAAHGLAKLYDFEMSPEFEQLVQLVLACEAEPYEIKLVPTDAGYTITNAANTLTDYIHSRADPGNIDWLIDQSAILGYTVDLTIKQQLAAKYSPGVVYLMQARQTRFDPVPDPDVLESIVAYATVVGRWPIYVYEPDMSDRLYDKFVATHFEQQHVHKIRDIKTEPDPDARVIFFHKYNPKWTQPIPLLLSSAGMMHGGEKSLLLQRAEKIVYFAADVYNNQQRRT